MRLTIHNSQFTTLYIELLLNYYTVRHNKTRLILHNSQFTTPKYYIPPTMLPIFFGCKDIRPLGRALVGRIVVPFLSPGHPTLPRVNTTRSPPLNCIIPINVTYWGVSVWWHGPMTGPLAFVLPYKSDDIPLIAVVNRCPLSVVLTTISIL